MRAAIACLAAAGLSACAAAEPPASAPPVVAPPEGAVIRDFAGGEEMSFAALLDRVRASDLVIIGELHDQPAHQRMQAAILSGAGVKAAAFEMIPHAVEATLAETRAAGGLAAADEATKAALQLDKWQAWTPPVEALPPSAPVIGAGLEREDLIAAIRQGGAAAFDGDSAAYGLDRPLPAAMQAAMVEEQIEAHCNALPAEMAPGMVEGQRLRDAAFAAALLRGHAEAGAPAALITGDGHARRGRGSPRYIAAAAPDLSLLVIGQVKLAPGQDWREATAYLESQKEGGTPVFDILVTTPEDAAAAGTDHCAGLRKRAEERARQAN